MDFGMQRKQDMENLIALAFAIIDRLDVGDPIVQEGRR
ncbi:hypothetical protein Rrhod_2373 [Rhodococcus rhodnii LMG 5362]|uniref:Uncharacterized protein n=1 Tax=Rhodococcus rhodnii LMG 5362 TaxID=1273125 RepID=R7WLV2_9NOCA|nr:hypothetical protein Rrhod_2373 [Rhodococcus rhodnii LMG 5362]